MIKTYYAIGCDFCPAADDEEYTWPTEAEAKSSARDNEYLEGARFDICGDCVSKFSEAMELLTGIEWDRYAY